jgi:hypothetical protein
MGSSLVDAPVPIKEIRYSCPFAFNAQKIIIKNNNLFMIN